VAVSVTVFDHRSDAVNLCGQTLARELEIIARHIARDFSLRRRIRVFQQNRPEADTQLLGLTGLPQFARLALG
jgi:hypothetical protein